MGASTNRVLGELRYLDLAYDHEDSENSAKELAYSIQSKWRDNKDQIEIVQFKG